MTTTKRVTIDNEDIYESPAPKEREHQHQTLRQSSGSGMDETHRCSAKWNDRTVNKKRNSDNNIRRGSSCTCRASPQQPKILNKSKKTVSA